MNYKTEILEIITKCAATGNSILEALKTLDNSRDGSISIKVKKIFIDLISENESARKLLFQYYDSILKSDISKSNYTFGLLLYYYHLPDEYKKENISTDVIELLNNKINTLTVNKIIDFSKLNISDLTFDNIIR